MQQQQQQPVSTIANRQQRYRMLDGGRSQSYCLLPQESAARANGVLGAQGGAEINADVYTNPWVPREQETCASLKCTPLVTRRALQVAAVPHSHRHCAPMELLADAAKSLPTAEEAATDKSHLVHKLAAADTPTDPQFSGAGVVHRRMGLLEIVKVNFVKYCQTTSLRGVPKIVKTKERLLKNIWASFVLTFFLGCVTCLALIMKQYLAYDVIHQPRTVRNYTVQFPSFTVCNTRPLSQDGIAYIRSHNLMLPKEYTQHVVDTTMNTVGNMANKGAVNSMRFNGTVKDALSTVFDTKGYYENVPQGVDITRFGHTLDQTILICESTIIIKDFKRSMFCDRIGTWTRTYDNKFLNCYTFTADDNYTKKILTVRIMGYTNERNLTNCPDCSSFPATQVSGLRVQLHNAGNYPEVQEEGLNLKPGSLTEIRFETKQWVMKEPPHGRCSRRVPPSMRFNNSSFTYSYQACKKKILHEQIRRQCGCLDSTIPLPDTMANSGAHYCGHIPPRQFSLAANSTVLLSQKSEAARKAMANYYSINASSVRLPSFTNNREFQDFIRRVVCNMEIFKVAGQVTANQCFTPCTYYTYETTISTTNWPTRAYLYEIVDAFRAMKARIDRLYKLGHTPRNSSYLDPVYKKLKETYTPVYETAKRNPAKAERMLKEIDYVQNNFIEILINRGKSNFDIEKIEEKAVISLTSLLSQIGGLLSIWVGLTFVCIVEIIEMVYHTVTMYSRRNTLPAS